MSLKLWITIIGAILAIIVSGITIYDRLQKDDFSIEQRLDPDSMKALSEGEEIVIEKGITIRRGNND